MSTEAYPLQWPEGWARTPAEKRVDGKHQFRRPLSHSASPFWTFGAARDALLDELRKLGAKHVVISCNFKPDRRDGLPVEGSRRPIDQGIAVYFMLHGTAKAMARDAYIRAEENMRSLTLAVEALRQLERHGGGTMMERAFAGFTALPPPRGHWEVLGLKEGAAPSDILRAYRTKAKAAHPDNGGSDAEMAALTAARDAALKESRTA